MTDPQGRRGPVMIELEEDAAAPRPDTAPPVPELGMEPVQGAAMQRAAALAGRRPSRLARWFWALAGALVTALLTQAAWVWVTGLIASVPVLGYLAAALVIALALIVLALALREITAFFRLARLDHLHKEAAAILASGDLTEARAFAAKLGALYTSRDDTSWGRKRLEERTADVFDADGLLALAERELLAPLDARAQREVEIAARQVATVTAVVPLAFADVFAALTSNLRMIRRVAEIYGGRSGTLGAWRLTRSVLGHLVATGAVAVGDDLIHSVAGGGLVSRVSRRFGEGVVNGALTARVGVAAMEVCRPLPFRAVPRPGVTNLVRRALTGLFARAEAQEGDGPAR
ncbi:YcjF family protein [Pseudoroseicyclus aestuarii]|uniref:Putative membrane protein n=1 Tax=Pseudoroseicyclus aestuarii TaxID=1795041 RepID=A0A318T007_9RHOB|nr:TIGR01620 family protein [Pseudoroseicyclus aestuarii]PYE82417.1 putative membrane protein [Pseudoroseicyclus aestuarii]